MKGGNVTEYKLLRIELESIKKCITDYMRFLFILVGASFSILGGIGAITNEDIYKLPIACSVLAISYIALSLLYILMYKFISHNRYAGYCLCLSQEEWNNDSNVCDIILWEVCVTLLRQKDIKMYRDGVAIPDELKDDSGNIISSNKSDDNFLKRLRFFIGTMLFARKTDSWGFPVTIVRIFLIVIISCIATYIYFIVPTIYDCIAGVNGTRVVVIMFIIAFIIKVLIGCSMINHFYFIMKGDYTIYKFCEHIKHIRKRLLEVNYGIDVSYIKL